MTLAARIAQLRTYRAHYAAQEQEPYVVLGDRDPRNGWTGLRRATERVLARLEPQEAPCSTDPFSEMPDASASSAARSPEVG